MPSLIVANCNVSIHTQPFLVSVFAVIDWRYVMLWTQNEQVQFECLTQFIGSRCREIAFRASLLTIVRAILLVAVQEIEISNLLRVLNADELPFSTNKVINLIEWGPMQHVFIWIENHNITGAILFYIYYGWILSDRGNQFLLPSV